jgi:hypothetical protein
MNEWQHHAADLSFLFDSATPIPSAFDTFTLHESSIGLFRDSDDNLSVVLSDGHAGHSPCRRILALGSTTPPNLAGSRMHVRFQVTIRYCLVWRWRRARC